MPFIRDFSFWVIGNGSKVHIWSDKWISCKTRPPLPAVSSEEASNYTLVSDLIDQDTKAWKVQLVQHIFTQDDAEIILQIHIPITNED